MTEQWNSNGTIPIDRVHDRIWLPQIQVEVLSGPDQGVSRRVERSSLRVGTDPANDLVLRDPKVSSLHLTVERQPHQSAAWEVRERSEGPEVVYVLKDRQSRNGTWVGDARIREVYVTPGLSIRLGDTVLRFHPQERPCEIEEAQETELEGMLGVASCMQRMFGILKQIARSESTVVLRGESGTGKERAAAAIHRLSRRKDGPFVVMDCAGIAPSVAESEIAGHLRGAFSGAHSPRLGFFEEAHRGTLFIDEIAEFPLEKQPLLLRALEEGMIRPIGSNAYRKVDVRVIAASHKDLAAEVEAGNFRQDLYFRLAVMQVEIPPLRDRLDDVPLLVERFLEQLHRKESEGLPASEPPPDVQGLEPDAMRALQRYPWSGGNVRELRNALEQAFLMRRHGLIQLSDLPKHIGQRSSTPPETPTTPRSYHEAKERCQSAFELQFFSALLKAHDFNVSKVARAADVNRKLIYRVMDKHGLKKPDRSSE